jgi:hypothetical protein
LGSGYWVRGGYKFILYFAGQFKEWEGEGFWSRYYR